MSIFTHKNVFIPQFTDEEELALKNPILTKYEKEGSPYYASAR